MTPSLWSATGVVANAPSEIIAAAAALSPTWRWVEPRPGSGLGDQGEPIDVLAPAEIHPLLAPGDAELPTEPCFLIDEARLFWPVAALHILADGVGPTRCAFWGIGEAPTAEQQGLIKTLGLTLSGTIPVQTGTPEPVLTRRDLERFGISASKHLPGKLTIQTYRVDGAIVAWTLGH